MLFPRSYPEHAGEPKKFTSNKLHAKGSRFSIKGLKKEEREEEREGRRKESRQPRQNS